MGNIDKRLLLLAGEIVRAGHADADHAEHFDAIDAEDRHRERAGDIGFPGIRTRHAAEILLQIAKFHRFAGLRRGTGDALAKGNVIDLVEQHLRHADLREQFEMLAVGRGLMNGAGLAVELIEHGCEPSVEVCFHGEGLYDERGSFSKIFLVSMPNSCFVLTNTVHQMSANTLTKRQQEILSYLKDSQRKTGIMPSTRELQHYFGFASQTAAMSHLRALEKKGVIQRLPGKARAVAFPDELDREEIFDIPIYGRIAAGYGDDTIPEKEGCLSIDIRSLGIQRTARTFALKVRGESMVDAHICDGDLVIMEFREPRHGDIVAALIDGETTLKRFLVEKGKAFLHAENKNFPDLIPARELIIQGVLVALLRQAA